MSFNVAAVVFDMDGLLVDSEKLWEESEVEVFAQVGIQMTPEMCWQTTGIRINEVVDYWFERHPWDGPGKTEVAEAILDGVIERIKATHEMLPGAPEAIAFFAGKQVKLGLASSSYYRLINAVLEHFDVAHYFDVVHSAQDETLGKPDPAVYLTTASKLGVAPRHCVALEDSLAGIRAAKAAGYRCIGVPETRFFDEEKFAEADVLLCSLREVDETLWASLTGSA